MIKVGDVVRLKSGGNAMTVYSVDSIHGIDEVFVACVWHDDEGRPQKFTYKPEVLAQ